jgi:hypothetical protein
MSVTMPVQTKFLRLRAPAALGDRIEGWRVCRLGGWDRGRVFFVVMAERSGEPSSSSPRIQPRPRRG